MSSYLFRLVFFLPICTTLRSVSSGVYTNKPTERKEEEIWDIRLPRYKRDMSPSNAVRHVEHRICGLDIYVDYSFYSIACRASLRCVVDTVTRTVSTADRKFRRVDFNDDGVNDNIGFATYRLVVNTRGGSPFTNTSDAHDLLFQMARHAYLTWPIGSCLSVLFVDRRLDNSVIGLAYTGQVSGRKGRVTIGGVCQPNAKIVDYNVRRYSTLFVSANQGGKHVSRATLQLTLTHELGHAFGAHHDAQVTPHFGTYVMHPTDLRPTMAYSFRFSTSSVKQMSPVVLASKCLSSVQPTCGNYVIDELEECDCGESRFCLMIDKCCVPSGKKFECKINRKLNYKCSPMSSACCSDICQVERKGVECLPASQCMSLSQCDGTSLICPAARMLDNGTLCASGTRVCNGGQCNVSRCKHESLLDCECIEAKCEYCCKRELNSTCLPIRILLGSNLTLHLQIYTFCEGRKGFCNKNHVCILAYKRDFQRFVRNDLISSNRIKSFIQSRYFIWGILLLIVSILLILLVDYNREDTLTFSAYNLSKYIWRNNNTKVKHKKYLHENNKLKISLHKVRQEFCECSGKMHSENIITSIARLCLLFPTTKRNVIIETMMKCYDESTCVRALISSKRPFIQYSP